MTVLGWFVVSHFAAADSHASSLREDRRAAYLNLLDTAQSCLEIENRSVLLRVYATWLGTDEQDTTDSGTFSVPPSTDPVWSTTSLPADAPREASPAILEAGGRRQLCRQLLSTAQGTIDLLTDDNDIRTKAGDLAQAASVLQGRELLSLEAAVQYEGNSAQAGDARNALDRARGNYDTKLDEFVDVAGEDTRGSRGWWGTLWPAFLIVVGALVMGVLLTHPMSLLRQWSTTVQPVKWLRGLRDRETKPKDGSS